jgi:chorismate mutase/prephenate dehydratase
VKEINQLLLDARKNINLIDDKILYLLEQRMHVVEKVTLAKKKQGAEIFAPDRELDLLKRIEKIGNLKGLDTLMLREVYRAIIEGSKREQAKALEDLVRIGFQGPRGSFCESAAKQQTIKGKTTTFVPFDDITKIFDSLNDKKIEFAVVPYQTSFEIGADLTIDLLLRSEYKIVGETLLPLDLSIISPSKNRKLEEIEKIYGTTWLFTRLGKLIDKLLPRAEKCEIFSNSFYIEAIKDIEHKSAAIGPTLFADLNKLFVLKKLNSHETGLISRYAVIGAETPKPTKKDFTTIAVELPNKKGCLNNFTNILAKSGISILNINLVYLRRKFCEHVFIVDLEGHQDSQPLHKALAQIKSISSELKILGSYPAHSDVAKKCKPLLFSRKK